MNLRFHSFLNICLITPDEYCDVDHSDPVRPVIGSGFLNWTGVFIEKWNMSECRSERDGAQTINDSHQEINHKLPRSSVGACQTLQIDTSVINTLIS